MSLTLVQKGQGPRRPLLLAYFIGPPMSSYIASLGPGPCILSDLDDQGGRFAKPPGAGGVQTLDEAIAAATKDNAFAPSTIVLLGWSAGCQAVRELLRSAAPRIDAAIALDGISGAVPPLPAQMAPWLGIAKRAAEDPRALCIVSHTQQTYTEKLPEGSRFASTVTTARIICEALGLAAPEPGKEVSTGCFWCISSPSSVYDGLAHVGQVRAVGPEAVRQKVVPWLFARGEVLPPAAAPRLPFDMPGGSDPPGVDPQKLAAARAERPKPPAGS